MATGRQIRAGGAVVEIAAENSKLKKDLDKSSSILKTWGKSLSGVGASISGIWATISGSAAVGMLASSIKSFADLGGELSDMSARTGVAASELQFLRFAAAQTGTSIEALEKSLKAMVKAGFKVEDFESLGKSIASIEDPTQRMARALAVFGKSGTELIPMFQQLNDLRKQSAAIGPILTDEEVARADKMGDSLGALAEAWSRLKQQIAASKDAQSGVATLTGAVAELADKVKEGGASVLLNPFLSVSASAAKERGKAATEASAAIAKQVQQQARAADTAKEQAKATRDLAAAEKERKKQWEDLAEKLREASKRRAALAGEFSTDEEKFIAKQKEIAAAIAEVRKSLVFIGQDNVDREVAMLEEAGRRNIRAQAAAQGKEFDRIGKELEGTVEVVKTISRGSTSAAGAALLGRSSESLGEVQRKSLDELKEANDHLKRISDRVGPAKFQ